MSLPTGEERKAVDALALYLHEHLQHFGHVLARDESTRKGIFKLLELYKSLGKLAAQDDGDLREEEIRNLLKVTKVPENLLGEARSISKIPSAQINLLRHLILASGSRRRKGAPLQMAITSKVFLRWVKSKIAINEVAVEKMHKSILNSASKSKSDKPKGHKNETKTADLSKNPVPNNPNSSSKRPLTKGNAEAGQKGEIVTNAEKSSVKVPDPKKSEESNEIISDKPPKWLEHKSKDHGGKSYYSDPETGKTTWTLPD